MFERKIFNFSKTKYFEYEIGNQESYWQQENNFISISEHHKLVLAFLWFMTISSFTYMPKDSWKCIQLITNAHTKTDRHNRD